MRLKAFRFGFSSALAATICHLLHAIFFHLWPLESLTLSAHLFFFKSLTLMYPYLRTTPLVLISGSIQIFLGVFTVTWLMAIIYNFGNRD